MKTHLIVLNEEVKGMALGEEGGAELRVLHVPGNRPYHQLMGRSPSGIWHWAGRLEPVLPLPELVGERHNGGVLYVVKAWFGRHEPGRLVAGCAAAFIPAQRIFCKSVAREPGWVLKVECPTIEGGRDVILTVGQAEIRDGDQGETTTNLLERRKNILDKTLKMNSHSDVYYSNYKFVGSGLA